MSNYPAPGSARFLNRITREAVEEITPVIDELLDTLLVDAYPPGAEPLTMRDLRRMPVNEAAEHLAGMVRSEVPKIRARGLELSLRFLDALAEVTEGEPDGAVSGT